jgi:hypothetical protein
MREETKNDDDLMQLREEIFEKKKILSGIQIQIDAELKKPQESRNESLLISLINRATAVENHLLFDKRKEYKLSQPFRGQSYHSFISLSNRF